MIYFFIFLQNSTICFFFSFFVKYLIWDKGLLSMLTLHISKRKTTRWLETPKLLLVHFWHFFLFFLSLFFLFFRVVVFTQSKKRHRLWIRPTIEGWLSCPLAGIQCSPPLVKWALLLHQIIYPTHIWQIGKRFRFAGIVVW